MYRIARVYTAYGVVTSPCRKRDDSKNDDTHGTSAHAYKLAYLKHSYYKREFLRRRPDPGKIAVGPWRRNVQRPGISDVNKKRVSETAVGHCGFGGVKEIACFQSNADRNSEKGGGGKVDREKSDTKIFGRIAESFPGDFATTVSPHTTSTRSPAKASPPCAFPFRDPLVRPPPASVVCSFASADPRPFRYFPTGTPAGAVNV